MTILDELAAAARERVERDRRERPLASLRDEAEGRAADGHRRGGPSPFRAALARPGLSFICEVKKASPSKGIIAEEFPYLAIAQAYEEACADAISVLTEPYWFLGADEYLKVIAETVAIPLLRKDFTVDEYQIYQAKTLGASAVLLICALLSDAALRDFRLLAEELGMTALVEAHDAKEIERALAGGANVLGVNNRNLNDFTVSFDNAQSLRSAVPDDVLFVAESGVKTAEDVATVAAMGADAVLIGEALMKSDDIAATLTAFKAAAAAATPLERAMPGDPVPSKGPRVKFCGLSQLDDVAAINDLAPDYVGFVYYPPSPRHVTPAEMRQLRAALAPSIQTVGVFVDEPSELIAELANEGLISVAQLHGAETDETIARLKTLAPDLEVWKTFLVKGPEDIASANASAADLVVLDADLGAGRRFDWQRLSGLHRPYVLAGGLSPENVAEACAHNPAVVDVSSGIESTIPAADGRRRKDPQKMERFIATVRAKNQ